MAIRPFLALERRRLSPTPETDRSCDGGRVRGDRALGWDKGLRARSITGGCAAGAEVCCWAHVGITPLIASFPQWWPQALGEISISHVLGLWLKVLSFNLSFFGLILLRLFRLHEVYIWDKIICIIRNFKDLNQDSC